MSKWSSLVILSPKLVNLSYHTNLVRTPSSTTVTITVYLKENGNKKKKKKKNLVRSYFVR
jgi:hypothetical protein